MRLLYIDDKMNFDEFITLVLEEDKRRVKFSSAGATSEANKIDFTKYSIAPIGAGEHIIGVHHRLMNSSLVDLHHFFHNAKREFLKLEERRENPQTDEVTRPGAFR